MPLLTGYYSPNQTVGLLEEESRNRNNPTSTTSSATTGGWTGTIGGTRMYLGEVPANATQAEAEAWYRNSIPYRESTSMGFLAPGAYNALNPNATAAERSAYEDLHNQRQGAINFSRGSLAERSGLGPLGMIGLFTLAAAGGAAATGALSGGGAGAAGAAGGTASGAAGGIGGIGGAASGTAAGLGTAGGAAGAAGGAGAAAGGGILGASAIPEIVVTGSAGGGAAGAAGAAGAGASFWDSVNSAASDTSSLNQQGQDHLNSLQAPEATYGVDWVDLAKRVGGALGQGQGQQTPMMGGGMPGLLGGGGGMASGVAPQRSRVLRSPLERYMALSQIGLLRGQD